MSAEQKALSAVRRATDRVATARKEQIEAMRRASLAGVPMRKIGEAAGITHGRVSQLLNGK